MRDYMQALANGINGTPPFDELTLQHTGFDSEYARIYANNSASALRDAVFSNFPTVKSLLGDKHTAHLTRLYGQKYPVTQRTLVGYGADFPNFITEKLPLHNLPYLHDFAALDHAWTQAHIALDAQSLLMQDLMDVLNNGGQLETHTVFLKPDVQLVILDWPIFDIWDALRRGQEMSETIGLEPKSEQVLVWRYNNEVMYRRLNADEHAFLDTIAKGQTLGEALNAAILATPNGDVTSLLPQMVEAEIFTKTPKGNSDAKYSDILASPCR